MSLIKIHFWRAVHTGGTKFYHVARIIVGGKVSYAIEHNGALSLFTGLGKFATGQLRVQAASTGVRAGMDKISEKRGGGYVSDEQESVIELNSERELTRWIKDNCSAKAQTLLTAELKTALVQDVIKARSPTSPDQFAPREREPDEPNHVKHADWGSW
jgi:hypothetical protein